MTQEEYRGGSGGGGGGVGGGGWSRTCSNEISASTGEINMSFEQWSAWEMVTIGTCIGC